MIFSIDLYSTKRNTFILKCFLQFTNTNLDGSQKEGGNFSKFLERDKQRLTDRQADRQRAGGRGGECTQKGGSSLRKGRKFQPWRKL